MKKRLLPLLLALAILVSAVPVGGVSAASVADNYDQVVAYINANGSYSDGVMTVFEGYEDTESGVEYLLVAQDYETYVSLCVMVFSLTDPGVNVMTTMNITRTGTTADLDFILLLVYGGEYVDAVLDSQTINRSQLIFGQEFTVAEGGILIDAASASQMYTSSMAMLCEYWNLTFTYELGFGLEGLGFTAYEGYLPVGYTLTGTVTSAGEGETVVTLTASTGEQASVVADEATGAYGFGGLPADTYTLTVTKGNHVTREYTLEVKGDVTLDCTISLVGDVNGDGKVNMKDWAQLYNHVTETQTLSGYGLECADVNADGKVNMKDWTRLYNHISEVDPLW